jgi:hypothetical protein
MTMTEMEIINERIDGVEEKIGNIDKNVNLMVILLRGNEFDSSDRGMIGKQTEQDRRIERLEKFKDKMIWVMIGAGVIGGLNLVQVIDMVRKAFLH